MTKYLYPEQLNELRSRWKRESSASFTLYQKENLLIVLVKRSQSKLFPNGDLWFLLRYFMIGSSWRLSTDVRDGSVEECLRTFEQERKTYV